MKKQTKYLLYGLILFTAAAFQSCDEYWFDDTPPAPPRNVGSFTGDSQVEVFWDYNRESDVAGYNVYYSYSYNGQYRLIGNTDEDRNYYIDYGAQNGVTYYYAVTAYDYNGNESELSHEEVYNTPRPEGFNVSIYDYLLYPNTSGYGFGAYSVLPYNDNRTDFFFSNDNGYFDLNVWLDTDIQDMGPTSDIYDINYAPNSGWVPRVGTDDVKYVPVVVGHTYVIWTVDNRYAKIRVKSMTSQRIVFDWAYQTAEGNRQLKRAITNFDRNKMPKEVLKSRE